MGMVVWCAAPKMQLDRSQSMPFLSRPPALDGTMAGDVGFDPLGFTNYFDIKWLREAELKHGRICMLGCLGFWVQEGVHLPLPGFDAKLPLDAFFSVPTSGLWQIFFTLGGIEVLSNGGKITPGDTLDTGDGAFQPARGCSKMKDTSHPQGGYGPLRLDEVFERSSNVGTALAVKQVFGADPQRIRADAQANSGDGHPEADPVAARQVSDGRLDRVVPNTHGAAPDRAHGAPAGQATVCQLFE